MNMTTQRSSSRCTGMLVLLWLVQAFDGVQTQDPGAVSITVVGIADVESYCFKTCGNFGKTYLYCNLGECAEEAIMSLKSPWYTDGTTCPLLCRRYDKTVTPPTCKGYGCYPSTEFSPSNPPCNISGCTGCPAFTYVNNMTGQSFFIRRTITGGTVYTADICPIDKKPSGQIKCLKHGKSDTKWDSFVPNQNCNFTALPDSDISDSLRNLSGFIIGEKNNQDILHSLIDITKGKPLNELDLLYTTTALEKITNVSSLTPDVVEGVVNMYNKVLETPDATLNKSQDKGLVANRMIEIMDNMTGKLILNSTGNKSIDTQSIGIEVLSLTIPKTKKLTIGIQLKGDDVTTLVQKEDVKQPKAAIILQSEALKAHKATNIQASMMVYKDPLLFSVSQPPDNVTLNSLVVSAKITVDGELITKMRGLNITTFLLPRVKLPLKYRTNLTVCAYWDFTGNDNRGSWSTDGCRYVGVTDGRDVCVCEHLTNFAVLMDFAAVSELDLLHSQSLSIISISGLGLSISGLSITLLTFIMFRRLRETQAQRTLFNLALAELCAWIVFLAGFNQTQNPVGCITAAALLHYFILASFMWMLAEAVLHYRLFVKVLGTYTSRYMLKTGLPAWGIPLLPVIAVLATDATLYMRDNVYCWLSLTAFYYAFALPVGLIILCNIVLYILVVVSICKKSQGAMTEDAKKERTQLNIRVSLLIFVLFGLSWIFGFLAVADAKVVFQYLFCITSSTQGFFIFLFVTVLNKHARDSWLGLCCGIKETSSKRRSASGIQLSTRSANFPNSKSQMDPSL